MTGPAAFPGTSPAVRIRKGEQIIALAWSNTATAIMGRFRVLYDSGKEDDFVLSMQTLTNGRVVNLLSAQQVATDNGWVLSGQMMQQPGVANQATQRGQLYVKACVVSGIDGPLPLPSATIPQCRATICQGYVYTGVEISVGQLLEAGPAGGPGQIRVLQTADPAAAAEIADQNVPASAIWLLRLFTVQIVQGITQTPLPTLEFEDISGTIQLAVIPAMQTALGVSSTAQLTWGIGLVMAAFTGVVADEFYTAPLPVIYLAQLGPLQAGIFATLTDGIGANTNYGVATYIVEEWVMPN